MSVTSVPPVPAGMMVPVVRNRRSITAAKAAKAMAVSRYSLSPVRMCRSTTAKRRTASSTMYRSWIRHTIKYRTALRA